ncbi:5-formyltetrahydrofolate cyclo-ligase [Robertmurraya yapensis]|uniref:5-formyltetrahydrofolate cyclo-ligase n=2 Tax=Bacillaceae TaxID=186817 RepID=A0A3S0ILQ7_9BACI|nr:5-formyltetrahydrofolate cyclo-ligase [Bacillus yapensis]RTR35273.1 5-formyltetrahydrofolate cyclo-ligase [Bacillus yapensis]TKS97782.1 5-formyltetrahydrofolate cyclo-ligase [Bacillus yapensis]
MKEKKQIRKQIQQQLVDLSKPDYEHFSYQIAQRLFAESFWKVSNTISITISRMPEVDTYQIIRRAWEEKKTVVVPKCYPSNRTMKFRVLKAFNELESVFYGLYEPKEDVTDEVDKKHIDLMIVPGLAFTKSGERLGFGGGYYDRYLEGYDGKKISLAFQQQVVSSLPVESHDIPLQKIITEEETIEING